MSGLGVTNVTTRERCYYSPCHGPLGNAQKLHIYMRRKNTIDNWIIIVVIVRAKDQDVFTEQRGNRDADTGQTT